MGFSFNPLKVFSGAAGALTGGMEAVSRGASQFAESARDAVADGLEFLGKELPQVPERAWAARTEWLEASRDKLEGTLRDVGDGMERMALGASQVLHGNFQRGFSNIGMGYLEGTWGAAAGNALITFRQEVSRIQVLAGIEKPGRGLTADEIATLREVYGDSIDYARIRIKEGDAGIGELTNRPFTSGNTIYMQMDPSNPHWKDTLVHETMHVWQFQHGGSSYQVGSLTEQLVHGTAKTYDWLPAAAEGKRWSQLNPEQQARLIENAYQAGMFSDPNAELWIDGQDYSAYTAYVRAAIADMRRGVGAH